MIGDLRMMRVKSREDSEIVTECRDCVITCHKILFRGDEWTSR